MFSIRLKIDAAMGFDTPCPEIESKDNPCEKHTAQGDKDTSEPKVIKERGWFYKLISLIVYGRVIGILISTCPFLQSVQTYQIQWYVYISV